MDEECRRTFDMFEFRVNVVKFNTVILYIRKSKTVIVFIKPTKENHV